MIAVHFNKDFAQAVNDALKNGKPIIPPSGKWTGNDMLTIAGILFAGVFSQGPHAYQLKGLPDEIIKKMPNERQEAVKETFNVDIHDGIDFVSTLMFDLLEGKFDADFKTDVKAIVYRDDNIKNIVPASGFKKHKNVLPE